MGHEGGAEPTRFRAPRDARLDGLAFQGDLRKYQRLILSAVGDDLDNATGDRRFHLVSPPGSGKTILGLEMIRRVGAPAVVFAPTVTIQRQWAEKAAMFAPSGDVSSVVSLDQSSLAAINVFTYQLIAAPAQADDLLAQAARDDWLTSLLVEAQVRDEAAAEARLATLESNNKDAYRREIARRAVRIKRQSLRKPSPDAMRFVHPNARDLIDRLVDAGVRTIVLDECHHLLDYWAVVISTLVARIDDVTVIGLTATLPSLDDGNAYENYTGLLGDVDFEVPTPAVVREGNLAPFRDLAYFVGPTEAEDAFLRNVGHEFEAAAAAIWTDERWLPWLEEARFGVGDTLAERWDDSLRHDASVAVAALRHLNRRQLRLPEEVEIPVESFDDETLDDHCALLAAFGLSVLKLSPAPVDHATLKALRTSLRPFGMTLTEAGLRQSRSAGDLILAYSSAKARAAGEILAAEAADLGPRFRAVLVTDFEKTGTVAGASGSEYAPGSARQVFLDLVRHPDAHTLDPVLVTGRTLWADADHGQSLVDHFNEYLEKRGANTRCAAVPSEHPGVMGIAGEGAGWGSGTYVAMVTAAFEAGVIRCLVGTRGLFAEGWDALSLNTLVDLTTATTATAAQQLRGRSIRTDPAWPTKCAHNWDIVCYAPGYAKGDEDVKRLFRRHAAVWGIVDPKSSPLAAALENPGPARVVKGIMHVSPLLANATLSQELKAARVYDIVSQRSLQAVGGRQRSYELWGVGSDYDNFTFSGTRLNARNLKIRTVFTMKNTLRTMVAKLKFGLAAAALTAVYYWFTVVDATVGHGSSLMPILGSLLALTAIVLAVNVRQAWKIARRIVKEQPADTILLDVGRAVAGALVETRLVSPNLSPDFVRVQDTGGGDYEVRLDYASPADADVFVRAFQEVLGPIRRPRYLVMRTESALPSLWLAPLWAFLRRVYRPPDGYPPAYHAVPSALATSKVRAEVFAKHWARAIGSGGLVYTHGVDGWRILQQARAQTRPKVGELAFEEWR